MANFQRLTADAESVLCTMTGSNCDSRTFSRGFHWCGGGAAVSSWSFALRASAYRAKRHNGRTAAQCQRSPGQNLCAAMSKGTFLVLLGRLLQFDHLAHASKLGDQLLHALRAPLLQKTTTTDQTNRPRCPDLNSSVTRQGLVGGRFTLRWMQRRRNSCSVRRGSRFCSLRTEHTRHN